MSNVKEIAEIDLGYGNNRNEKSKKREKNAFEAKNTFFKKISLVVIGSLTQPSSNEK